MIAFNLVEIRNKLGILDSEFIFVSHKNGNEIWKV